MAKNDKMEVQKEAKLKALDEAIAHIEKQYGKGSVMKLGDPSVHMNVETVPTGCLSLDISRWDLAVCQEDVSLRCTDRNPVVRLP